MVNKAIGVFDSGVGGLTVVRELAKQLPEEDIVYFGDTARVPYGNKSTNTIQKFSLEIMQFLLKNNVKAIVIACNSASAAAADLLKNHSPVPILGVIDAGVVAAAKKTTTKKIGIIGTKATIRSHAHRDKIKVIYKDAEIHEVACPLFVPIVEEGMTDTELAEKTIEYYLQPLKGKIDTLILGCTHYPILRKQIETFLGPDVIIVDPAAELASLLRLELGALNLLKSKTNKLNYNFFVSDLPEDFVKASSVVMDIDNKSITKVQIPKMNAEVLGKLNVMTNQT